MTRGVVGERRAREIQHELLDLPRLSRYDLVERWTELYGAAPPPRTSRSLMIRAVAYKLQERAFGALKPEIRRALLEYTPSAAKTRQAPRLSPGTVLLREWQGVTHQVTILEEGVLYQGKRYRSTSAVARTITGGRWSGPRFFGLKDRHG